jgi:hypothetical protein
MAKLGGVEPFPRLWERRTTFELGDVGAVDVLSLPNLEASKKTQLDKDWVMIRRLLDASCVQGAASPAPERVVFWLNELRRRCGGIGAEGPPGAAVGEGTARLAARALGHFGVSGKIVRGRSEHRGKTSGALGHSGRARRDLPPDAGLSSPCERSPSVTWARHTGSTENSWITCPA